MGPGIIYFATTTGESIDVSTVKKKLLTNINMWYITKDHNNKVYNYCFLFKKALQFGIFYSCFFYNTLSFVL